MLPSFIETFTTTLPDLLLSKLYVDLSVVFTMFFFSIFAAAFIIRVLVLSVFSIPSGPDKADILNAVRLLRQKLDKAMELKLDKAVSQIESCDKLLKLYSPEKRLEQSEKAVCDLEKRLSQIMERRLEKLSAQLDGYVSSLNMLSPFNVLGRGYAIVQKGECVVDSVSMLKVGDEVNIKLSDGSVSAKIMSIK